MPEEKVEREDVTFENVDVKLLDRQRLALERVLCDTIVGRPCSEEDSELVSGLQNMLDDWSDERYHAAGGGT